MSVLLKTRCTKGHLVIYGDKVAIELVGLGVHNVNALTYNQITGVEIKTTMAAIPLFFKGTATVIIFGTGNQKLEAPLVALKEAKEAKELIEERIGKDSPSSSLSDLEKLSELRDKGVITQDEFEKKKKQLLGI